MRLFGKKQLSITDIMSLYSRYECCNVQLSGVALHYKDFHRLKWGHGVNLIDESKFEITLGDRAILWATLKSFCKEGEIAVVESKLMPSEEGVSIILNWKGGYAMKPDWKDAPEWS